MQNVFKMNLLICDKFTNSVIHWSLMWRVMLIDMKLSISREYVFQIFLI